MTSTFNRWLCDNHDEARGSSTATYMIKWSDPFQLTSTLSMQALQVLSVSIHKAKGKKLSD